MRENGNWGQDRGVPCRNCGAANSTQAVSCASCGATLNAPEQQVIDVSTPEPRVVTLEEREVSGWQGWGGERIERGRVYVARGGRTTCLLLNVLVVLLLCCVCWVLWTSVGAIF